MIEKTVNVLHTYLFLALIRFIHTKMNIWSYSHNKVYMTNSKWFKCNKVGLDRTCVSLIHLPNRYFFHLPHIQ